MNRSKISVRYARALYLLAVEHNLTDRILEDIHTISQAFRNSELVSFFENPVITPGNKKELVGKLFGPVIHDYSLRFLELLLDNHRDDFIQDISRYFIDLHWKENRITRVRLVTATAISRELSGRIVDLAGRDGDRIDLVTEVNPGILGGFILQIDDKRMDASVTRQLKTIQRKLITREYIRKI